MGSTTTVKLDEHLASFVRGQVSEGHFADAGEVMRAALRFMQERERDLATLRAELVKGEESGRSRIDVMDLWEQVTSKQKV